MLKALLAAVLMALPLPLVAEHSLNPCAPAEEILTHLERKYKEQKVLEGLSSTGERMVLLAGPGRAYTIIRISPQGIACLLDAGEALSVFPPTAAGEPS